MDDFNVKALKELEDYRKAGCHMMTPQLQSLEAVVDGYQIIVSPVQILSHPKDGDVYPHDQTDWDKDTKTWKKTCTGEQLVRFHAQAFQKLAKGANILWSQPKLKIDPKFPRVLCDISGAVRNPDGNFYTLPDFAGSDLDIIKEQLIAGYSFNGKFDDKKQWMVDRDFLQKKTHQQKACITTAKNRVTARILGLKNTYTVNELEKAFIFVQIVFRPDMKDEYTRRLVVQANVLNIAMNNVFGVQNQTPPDIPAIEYLGEIPADKCVDDNTIEAETVTETGRHYQLDAERKDMAEALRIDFQNQDPAGQAKTIGALVKTKKDTKVDEYLKSQGKILEELKPGTRLDMFNALVALPTPGTGDVPFAMNSAAS